MKYNTNKKGEKLSILGYGCMRLPPNPDEAKKLILQAVKGGVNYFDTAYMYQGNEVLLGNALSDLKLRDKVNIATKIPSYMIKSPSGFEKIFNTQLDRLKTDHIDYYLMHQMMSADEVTKLTDSGILKAIEAKKQAGQIKNFGFSFHGTPDSFVEIIDAYDWDFCMIQFNYIDEHYQAGIEGLKYAASKGLPVIIMEPLRGGELVNNLPPAVLNVWRNAQVKYSPAERGLRWVWNHPEATVVLSGMGKTEMLHSNIAAANRAETLTEADLALYDEVKRILMSLNTVRCTGCRYCMPCPAGVDIPLNFSVYNDYIKLKKIKFYIYYIYLLADKNASRCINCGRCAKLCPQHIAIPGELKTVAKKMERFPYGIGKFLIKKFMLKK